MAKQIFGFMGLSSTLVLCLRYGSLPHGGATPNPKACIMTSVNILALTPQEFVGQLKQWNIRRFHLVLNPETNIVEASHDQLQPLADFINADGRDFMGHEGMFFQVTRQYETLQGAFVHRTCRGQAAGGVRYWNYDTVEDYLRDGMRLGKGMTRKNALAGIWWGGGKGVMAYNPQHPKGDPSIRESLYQEYGELLSATRGCYVTAEDVGTHVVDMANVFATTRFTTCIPAEVGGSGNPSAPTARGVVAGMEAALEYAGMGSLEGKTVAVQGMGNVGAPLIGFLFGKGVKRVVACDISEDLVASVTASIKEKIAGNQIFETRVIDRNDQSILAEKCDIVAPCATGATINPMTIDTIKAPVICGAANNQLEDAERDGADVSGRGIIYVPDFLTNRMGIVNCANEAYGYVNDDPFIERHLEKEWEHSVYQTTLRVLGKAKEAGLTTARAAMDLADELSLEEHPVFGHRGIKIIGSLVQDHWYEEEK
jgi:glutamate dehydrogenase/leucine dehydrogenase